MTGPSVHDEEAEENLKFLTEEERELLAKPVVEPPDPDAVPSPQDLGATDVPDAKILDTSPRVEDVSGVTGFPDAGHERDIFLTDIVLPEDPS